MRGYREEKGDCEERVIERKILDDLTVKAKESLKLRMNYNVHQSLDDKCHRMLNAIEPGTDMPIHRHPDKDESFVVSRGQVRSTTYNDDGSVIVKCSALRRGWIIWSG